MSESDEEPGAMDERDRYDEDSAYDQRRHGHGMPGQGPAGRAGAGPARDSRPGQRPYAPGPDHRTTGFPHDPGTRAFGLDGAGGPRPVPYQDPQQRHPKGPAGTPHRGPYQGPPQRPFTGHPGQRGPQQYPPNLPYVPPPDDEWGKKALSLLWSFSPLMTCGFGTPFTFLFAAIKNKSWLNAAVTLGYSLIMVIWFAIADSRYDEVAPVLSLAIVALGTTHALGVRREVFGIKKPKKGHSPNERALALAQYRRELRAEARRLVAEDGALARELRIGRPDLPRSYDDGGLIDINHASAEALTSLPSITPEIAEKIVSLRESVGPFISADELSVTAALPPNLTAELEEYTIYLP
ncbi:helix-hairpin-helix domain-containing protein [Rhizohabitans arisaemae]|uniref:helix-hairpin-helix domain-containing protein n=1 Tax=Rhizohabitans arisaemae TaxID=2720610 RepID=UPI0024B0CBBD|nr:helix-hairpin-helix domain-containing protein [Rhizohabitans arisaemae]